MEYTYRLIDGNYVLHAGNEPIKDPIPAIAFAFDLEDGCLHKHGAPQMVDDWVNQTAAKFKNHPDLDLTKNIAIVEGRFPIEEVNRCLDTTGYISRMMRKMAAGEIKPVPFPAT